MLLSAADAAQDGFLHKLNKQVSVHSFHSLEAVIIIAGLVCAQWASVLSMVCQQTLVHAFVETLTCIFSLVL